MEMATDGAQFSFKTGKILTDVDTRRDGETKGFRHLLQIQAVHVEDVFEGVRRVGLEIRSESVAS
jgi:hypothetical protein